VDFFVTAGFAADLAEGEDATGEATAVARLDRDHGPVVSADAALVVRGVGAVLGDVEDEEVRGFRRASDERAHAGDRAVIENLADRRDRGASRQLDRVERTDEELRIRRGLAREGDHRRRCVDAEDVEAGVGQGAREYAAATADVDDETAAGTEEREDAGCRSFDESAEAGVVDPRQILAIIDHGAAYMSCALRNVSGRENTLAMFIPLRRALNVTLRVASAAPSWT
jgi:hypothetical protein